MSRPRLLLVGLDNPQSNDPRHALFPAPEKCTGWRIWKMLQDVEPNFTRGMYHQLTKTNLFPLGPAPKKMTQGHHFAGVVMRMQLADQGRRVILLGNTVRDALMADVDQPEMMEYIGLPGSGMTIYAWIPHPSGTNRFYNDDKDRRKVSEWLMKEVRAHG